MPGTTSTQKLTYPTSGDPLKQHAQYIETLARQVDARVNSHADSVAAQLNRPFAVLDATTQRGNPTSVAASPASAGYIIFDSVVVDTAGMVDLTADNRIISLNSPGTWLIGAYVDYVGIPGGSGCTSSGSLTMNLHVQNANPSTFHSYVKDFNALHTYLHCTGLTRFTSATTIARVFVDTDNQGTGCAAGLNIYRARMWAFKVREV